MLAIDVRGLRKAYGPHAVLRDVTFDVEAGQTVALLGPNGAGKTTTVEVLEGFRRRDAGDVTVLGEDPAQESRAFRLRVGVVLQETRHDHYLTLGETVDLVRGWYPDPLPAAEVLEAVSLGDHVRHRVATLSGGQLRRLDVALGIVGRPDVLFLDEPTTGFDPDARRQTWDVVRRLRDRGTTVLLTTHYLDEAEALADRVLVLHGGRVVANEPPAKLGNRDRTHLVSFVPSSTTAALPPLGGVVTDGRWAVETDDVTHAVHELSRWAQGNDQPLQDLVIVRRSLEDAYLELIR